MPLISPLPLSGARAALDKRCQDDRIPDLDFPLNHFKLLKIDDRTFEIRYFMRVRFGMLASETCLVTLQPLGQGTQATLEKRPSPLQGIILTAVALAACLVAAGAWFSAQQKNFSLALGLALVAAGFVAALIQRLRRSLSHCRRFLAQTLVANG